MFSNVVSRSLAGLLLVIPPMVSANGPVSQVPLFLGGGGVPGNMVLTPSVEWPTVESVANLGAYTSSQRFEGYFDADKCYRYRYADTESERHFYPSSITSDRSCAGAQEWSGNYLNWATTQTIDPFRKVLTGGLRVKDTPQETWLEKARHPGQGIGFPLRDLADKTEIQSATPFARYRIQVQVGGLGTRMRFSLDEVAVETDPQPYQPGISDLDSAHAFEMSVRVKVCDPTVGVEENCKQYAQGWKPEGLIQRNADRIRFSVFGYLNDSRHERDGGVLRARQKYVGPLRLTPGVGLEENPNAEWDAVTGVLRANPDREDAAKTASGIQNSGVINYLNKFGQFNTGDNKTADPVSELYYSATRYLKNQGNVPSYSGMGGATASQAAQWRDGFPVIEDWDDPIQYECQPNVILGIGDVNTHDDKNLPGNDRYRVDEPAMPAAVRNDDSVDVLAATNQVGLLEGLGYIGNTSDFSGRQNSAYIAGLAYHNHTRDLRPDLAGDQTASTHWVDVLENQVLERASRNQYYLATKYGGFDVPEDFDPETRITALPEAWWHSNGERLTPTSGNSFPRPDNYYVAGQADRMIESLRRAFANITTDLTSSAASVATNSTRLDVDTAVFQASFNSRRWSGDLKAYPLQDNGSIAADPAWSASARLDAGHDSTISMRNVFTSDSLSDYGAVAGERLSTRGKPFLWPALSSDQREALSRTAEGETVPASRGAERVSYLRGDRSLEQTTTHQSLPFRQRDSRLGDIVNSSPQYVHKQDWGYQNLTRTAAFSAVSSYQAFRASSQYQSRSPMVLVGANDGMLHGFNADVTGTDGGKELFAYVPASAIPELWRLTDPDYDHRYYVDGTARVGDAWLDSARGWRTLAVGTAGAGGRSVFALDVTDPANISEHSLLWEFTHPDMGLTIQQAALVPLANGRFGVIVTSGYDTASASGQVWVLDAATGRPMATLVLPGSGELGSPLVVDLDRDRIADRLYVGDSEGQLWRVDLAGNNPAHWGVPKALQRKGNPVPLFIAPVGQAISAPLASAFNDNGEHMVYFGTGSFFRIGENVPDGTAEVQAFYGIIDRGDPVSQHQLLEQEVLGDYRQGSERYRAVTDRLITASHKGWFIKLPGAAERVVARALVRGDRVIFATLIPSADPCAAGGDSWLMELSTTSGSRLDYSVFDLNKDGRFNDDDYVEIEVDGEIITLPTSGLKSSVGIFNTPAIIRCEDDECKVLSGSSGQMMTIFEAGSRTRGRQSWQQLK